MTSIEWTLGDDGSADATWNPATGCDRISPGCDHCYALTMARRMKAMRQAKYQNDGGPRTSGPGSGLTVHPDMLGAPLHWRKPRRVFVNSMSDLFHAGVPVSFIGSVSDIMASTPRHTYQVLTKRPERMRPAAGKWADAGWTWRRHDLMWCGPAEGPLPNVHLGTSIELDKHTRRAGDLRETPAAVRFLSLEPLPGPLPSLDLTGIHQVILGGESGTGARPIDLGWVRDLITQCRATATAVFVKQLGTRWAPEHGDSGKGGDWDRWPADLRIREFPAAADAESGTGLQETA